VTLMLVAGGGVAVGVGRTLPDTVDAGWVLGEFLDGVVEGRTAGAGTVVTGAVLGCAQLGGLAGTVGIALAGLAVGDLVGDLVVGSAEACAAGETEAPDVTAGWLACWTAAVPECPVSDLTAAYVPPPKAMTSRTAPARRVPAGRRGGFRWLAGLGRGTPGVAGPDGGCAAPAKTRQNGSLVSVGSFCGSSKYPRTGPVPLAVGVPGPPGSP
jgi:hypothetical protein